MEEEYEEIGEINIKELKKNYDISTSRLIITKERIEHINKRHQNDYKIYGKYIKDVVKNPDYILEDIKNINTVLYLKKIKDLNLQVVVKLQIKNTQNKANTIITFWHMRERSYNQIIQKNKKIYEKLDKNE